MRTKLFIGLILLLICLFSFSTISFAEMSGSSEVETVTIPKDMLTSQQKTELAQQDLQNRMDTFGKWVGVGKEIGVAVDSSLSAITKRASEFADTKLGSTIVWLVVYKVVGTKVIQLAIGIPLLIFLLIMWSMSFRRCFTYRILAEKSGPWWARTRKYTTLEPGGPGADYNRDARKVVHFFVLLGIIGVCAIVLFAG